MKQSISELSHLTGMDRRRIRKALADLPAEKGKKGALIYESTEALPLLYMLPGDGDTYDLTQERARLAHHQANKAELECQALAGDLVSVEEVAEEVGNQFANVRAKLLAIPSKAAPVLTLESDERQVFALIQNFIYEALTELSESTD